MSQAGRPISPHLQIYRWYLTMATSILHRVTGVALAAGLLGLTWWLTALAAGPASFERVTAVLGHPLGLLILFGFTAALFYHLCNGIRHLAWDMGFGFDKDVARQTGLAVFAATGALTLVTWLAVMAGG
jgi:succinate dehydrogenase / fumarate reductase cytochrome b subunit